MINVKMTARLRKKMLPRDIENRLPLPLTNAGQIVRDEARTLLGTQGPSGSAGEGWPTYWHKKLRAWVKASSPSGTPPHRQAGDLQNSVKLFPVKKTEIVIAATAPYAAALESGSRKRFPRPFMAPALANSVKRIFKSFYHFLGA